MRVAHLRLVAALVALALGVLWSRSVADRVASRLGSGFGRAICVLTPAAPTADALPADDVNDAFGNAADDDGIGVGDTGQALATGAGGRKSKGKRTAVAHSVFVAANTVLRLANSGVRPSAVAVAAKGDRPAGLSLRGVSGLGVGMRDGDVLTEVAGQPVRAVGDVVSIVLVLRSKLVPRINGAFWRGGARWTLVVEQPYVVEPVGSHVSP